MTDRSVIQMSFFRGTIKEISNVNFAIEKGTYLK